MNIFNLLARDEYKQQQISKFIVEGALLQFATSSVMMALFVFTSIEPFILLMIPCLIFLFYVLVRYILSGIEFTEVFTKEEYKQMRKKNLIRSLSFSVVFAIQLWLFGRSTVDIIAIALIAGLIWLFMDTISLHKSFRKNQSL